MWRLDLFSLLWRRGEEKDRWKFSLLELKEESHREKNKT